MVDRDAPATPHDLKTHADSLQKHISHLLLQFKVEILAEQERQLEKAFLKQLFGPTAPADESIAPERPKAAKKKKPPPHKPAKRSPVHSYEPSAVFSANDLSPRLSKASEASGGTGAGTESIVADLRSSLGTDPSTVMNSAMISNMSPATGISNITPGISEYSLKEKGTFGAFRNSISYMSNQIVGKQMSVAAHQVLRRFKTQRLQNQILVDRHGTKDVTENRGSQDIRLPEVETAFGAFKNAPLAFVRHALFDAFCGIVICLNAILVGIETEYLAQDGESPQAIHTLQMVLNFWYVNELVLRMAAFKSKFWCGEDRNWNMFDLLLVVSAMVDLWTNINIQDFKAARILRALRLFRIVRTLRIIRTLKYIREFRKMVYSLISSIQTLVWSLVLVFGVMYSFALLFTQNAAYIRLHDLEDHAKYGEHNVALLDHYYSSFSRTIYTLFAAISGGYSWHVLMDPWLNCQSDLSVIFFVTYISVSFFGLLNIVTSVFVESAMHATQHFQELLMDAKKKDVEMYSYHMKRIFNEIDTDAGGTISFKEMKCFLQDGTSELPQYLEALGISSSDVWVLFKLLDRDMSGMIDIEEFCEGCMRLKGEAKSFDINCMIYESRAMIHHQSTFMEFVEEQFETLEKQADRMVPEIDKKIATRMQALYAVQERVLDHVLNKLGPLTPQEARELQLDALQAPRRHDSFWSSVSVSASQPEVSVGTPVTVEHESSAPSVLFSSAKKKPGVSWSPRQNREREASAVPQPQSFGLERISDIPSFQSSIGISDAPTPED